MGQQQLQRCWYWRKQQIWNLKWCSIRFVFRIFITACAFLGIMGLQAFQHWNIGEKRRGRTPRLDVLKPYEIDMLTQAVLVLLVLYTIKLHPMISYSIISHLTITISHYISLYPNISHDIIMISKSYSGYHIGVYPLHLITSHYPITSHYIQYITWYHHDIQIIFFIYIQYIHYILYIYSVLLQSYIYIQYIVSIIYPLYIYIYNRCLLQSFCLFAPAASSLRHASSKWLRRWRRCRNGVMRRWGTWTWP